MPRTRPPIEEEDNSLADLLKPSKTRLKKESHDLQDLGLELEKLPRARIEAIEMPENLRDAILELKRTKSHEGRRRQLQYVGKLMRTADAEPIREALAALQLGSAKATLALHRAERWRAELIASDDALTRWVDEHPGTDVQQLRNLVRAARKDATIAPEQRSGKGFRDLYQFVRGMLDDKARAAGESSDDEEPGDE